MSALFVGNPKTITRPVLERDARMILRLLEESWRVHLRLSRYNMEQKLRYIPGVLAEDQVGLRGFMLVEPQPPEAAVIIAAGLRDTWGVKPFLEMLLPEAEQIAQRNNVAALVYLGYEEWLIKSLPQYGFEPKDWILTFERQNSDSPPTIPALAHIRTAHRNDLPILLSLDNIAFDHLWRKSAAHFGEALAYANSFSVAEVDGQIVGYEWCDIHQHRAHLTRLAVHPAYQGQGIGGQLLQQAVVDVLSQGVSSITLNTQETNQRSRALYTRFGFVDTQQRIPVLWKMLN